MPPSVASVPFSDLCTRVTMLWMCLLEPSTDGKASTIASPPVRHAGPVGATTALTPEVARSFASEPDPARVVTAAALDGSCERSAMTLDRWVRIYGAEAASRYWFHKPASSLLPEEAALLTAMLPAPRTRNPRHPSEHLRRRAFTVLKLYGLYGQLTPEQVAEARKYLGEMVTGPVATR